LISALKSSVHVKYNAAIVEDLVDYRLSDLKAGFRGTHEFTALID